MIVRILFLSFLLSIGFSNQSFAQYVVGAGINNGSNSASYTYQFTASDWISGELTIPNSLHNLGTGYKHVTVYNDSNEEVDIYIYVDPSTGDVTIKTNNTAFSGTIHISN